MRADLENKELTKDKNSVSGKMRHTGIDTIKFFAILAVVIVHVPILSNAGALPYLPKYSEIVTSICRFAVPFFFITSGYFLHQSAKFSSDVGKLAFSRTKRLISIFVIWFVILALIPDDWNTQLHTIGVLNMIKLHVAKLLVEFESQPQLIILRGTGFQLWFISSLTFSIGIVLSLVKFRLEKLILPLGVILYCWSVLGGAYRTTPISVSTLGIGYLSPLVSTLFVGIGWLFGNYLECPYSRKTAYKIFFLGISLTLIESYAAWSIWKTDFADGYFFMTPLFATGAFLLAWSYPQLGQNSLLPKLGLYTLGVYMIHPLLIGPCHGILKRIYEPLIDWNFALTFIVSFGIIYLISRIKQLKIYVM